MTDGPVPVVARVDLGEATLLPDVDRGRAFLLAVDGVPQSYVDLDDPAYLEFEYVRRLAHVADLIAPGSVLHLGGGGMSLPRYIAATRPGTRQRVAEVDARLLDLVRRELPFDPSIEVVRSDARAAVEACAAGSVELIVADVFAGSRVPPRVVSSEFFTEVRRVLAGGGCYVANLADQVPFDFARAVTATAHAVLGRCRLAAEPAVFRGRRFGNLLLICGDPDAEELARRLAGDAFPARLQDADGFVHGARILTDAMTVPSPEPPPGYFTLP